MELWFWAAVAGAAFAGLSNFYFKQAAVRGYNAELFSFYGALISMPIVAVGLVVFSQPVVVSSWIIGLMFCGGLLAAITNILKIYALKYIDSTIYFPLFKLLAPGLAIVFGVSFFAESFSVIEWFGLVLGLLVPLLLITKVESTRQANLLAGLLLVLITGILSASNAAFGKFATDEGIGFLTALFWANLGVVLGSLCVSVYKTGMYKMWYLAKTETSIRLLIAAGLRSSLVTFGYGFMLYAFVLGGTLAVVQTIHSMYILIPIVLSIIFYNEHWNLQKALAIVLSLAALALLG